MIPYTPYTFILYCMWVIASVNAGTIYICVCIYIYVCMCTFVHLCSTNKACKVASSQVTCHHNLASSWKLGSTTSDFSSSYTVHITHMYHGLPSGNQTWQWKIDHLSMNFLWKPPFIGDFPASHVWVPWTICQQVTRKQKQWPTCMSTWNIGINGAYGCTCWEIM